MTAMMAEPVGALAGGAAGNDAAQDRPRRPLALSPSRASDFKSCPLLYRLRAVDRLPEPPSPAAVRGTLVHSVLEEMFGCPAADRTPDRTVELVEPAWERMAKECPELAGMLPADDVAGWLGSAESLVRSYFDLEDPRRFDPQACEFAVEIDADGVPLRGFIDRLDLAPTGELRIVDYKTGRSPSPDFEGSALYQLKFYALMIYRLRGVVPTQLKLIYLADGLSLQYSPSEAELVSFANSVGALWRAVAAALETGNFPARRGPMCRWCSHQALCPEYGGTPPPYPGPPAIGLSDPAAGDGGGPPR
ncbi:MAG TPA: PD-(D/E)XK nuclease family protein [Nakamurella sp.]